MNKILLTKYWAIIFLSSTFVAVSYQLKIDHAVLPGIPSYVLAIFTFILGAPIANFLISMILRVKNVRKLAMFLFGGSCIEGHWLISAHNNEGDPHPLSRIGVLYLRYDPGNGELVATTTRYDVDGEKILVNSELAFAREEKKIVRYLNYFTYSFGGKDRNGMAFSRISEDSEFSKGMNSYAGTIVIEGEGAIRSQHARKIPDKKARELYQEYGDKWIEKLLASNGSLVDVNPSDKDVSRIN